ncbi:enoyl-CoA hydratase/isomerase family protein [Mycobacterium sp.]|uniref:enoyl-CoA hydratase/isomerase family protein n=1 Tax=Mycobacterium sp. TaxID=1785 RepID=UPI003C7567BA
MIEIQAVQDVRVLTLSSGPVNALDVEVLDELTEAFRELGRSGGPALVVTGAGRAFSAGVDLTSVVQGGSDYTDRLVPALSNTFDALFSYPGPTVAAINGAAIAGGCVLACAADRRLISPNAQIGATEVHVGVPFPVAALEVVRYACGDRAEDVLLGGRTYRGPTQSPPDLPIASSPRTWSTQPSRRRRSWAVSQRARTATPRPSYGPPLWRACMTRKPSTARSVRCGVQIRRNRALPPIWKAFGGADSVLDRDPAPGAPASV